MQHRKSRLTLAQLNGMVFDRKGLPCWRYKERLRNLGLYEHADFKTLFKQRLVLILYLKLS